MEGLPQTAVTRRLWLSLALACSVLAQPALRAAGGAEFLESQPPPVGPVELGDNQKDRGPGFQWKPALLQAALFMTIQHSYRVTREQKTKDRLGGPFFADYWDSLKGIRGWRDTDSAFTNYVAHPFMGATSGFIQVQNDPGYLRARFGANRLYWQSRTRAFVFAAAYSTFFELGPVSEASIGNVGQDRKTMGAVDLVMTPIGGLSLMVAEDALDRYVVESVERSTTNVWLRGVTRTLLNPNRTVANVLGGRAPWRRERGRIGDPYF